MEAEEEIEGTAGTMGWPLPLPARDGAPSIHQQGEVGPNLSFHLQMVAIALGSGLGTDIGTRTTGACHATESWAIPKELVCGGQGGS